MSGKRAAEAAPEGEPAAKKAKTSESAANASAMGLVTVLTEDQSATLDFYTQKLGFEVSTDIMWGQTRWLTIKAKGSKEQCITIVLASSDAAKAAVGKQAGDHVFLVVHTDDMAADYARLEKDSEVVITTKLSEEFWGHSCVLKDNNGNLINLLEPKEH